MWKNIFIESSILSLLIFGGFYINASVQKEKISASEEKVRLHQDMAPAVHISGVSQSGARDQPAQHVSGGISTRSSRQKDDPQKERPGIGVR